MILTSQHHIFHGDCILIPSHFFVALAAKPSYRTTFRIMHPSLASHCLLLSFSERAKIQMLSNFRNKTLLNHCLDKYRLHAMHTHNTHNVNTAHTDRLGMSQQIGTLGSIEQDRSGYSLLK